MTIQYRKSMNQVEIRQNAMAFTAKTNENPYITTWKRTSEFLHE